MFEFNDFKMTNAQNIKKRLQTTNAMECSDVECQQKISCGQWKMPWQPLSIALKFVAANRLRHSINEQKKII